MSSSTLAKQKPKPPASPTPRRWEGDEAVLTTLKARKRLLRTIRQIAAHQDMNQEDVLDMFVPLFEECRLTIITHFLNKKGETPEVPPDDEDPENPIVTVKAHRGTALIIRQIAAHLDVKQDRVLAIFSPQIDEHLRYLMAQHLGKKPPRDRED